MVLKLAVLPTKSKTAGKVGQHEMQTASGHRCIHHHASRATKLPHGSVDPRVQPPRKQGDAQQQEHQCCQGANDQALRFVFSEFHGDGLPGILNQMEPCRVPALMVGQAPVQPACVRACLYICSCLWCTISSIGGGGLCDDTSRGDRRDHSMLRWPLRGRWGRAGCTLAGEGVACSAGEPQQGKC